MKFRIWLIKLIANGEPICMNWLISDRNEKQDCTIYIPEPEERLTSEEAEAKAVMVPLRNIKETWDEI